MAIIKYTVPHEMEFEFEQAFFDTFDRDSATQKIETTLQGRDYLEYQHSVDKLNLSQFNILDELESVAGDLYNRGYTFDIEVKFINRGLRGNLTFTHVFTIDSDNPETYIIHALRNAFEPLENFTDENGTTLGFKKSDEFMEALRQLQITDKPDFNHIAIVDESKIHQNQKQFLDDSTIEEAIRAAKVDVTTAHLIRTQLSKIPNVAEHVFYITNVFFLGWLRNQRPEIGTWLESDWEDFCYVACKTADLENCYHEWWSLDASERYAYYQRNKI